MRILVALGGNALLRRGEPADADTQRRNVEAAAAGLAELAADHELILTHGNGPQVGLLALQQEHGEPDAPALPFDAMVAMTQGQIGYLLQDALACVDPDLPTATVLTRARVAGDDPAFASAPTKPIGPFYDEDEARRLADARGWDVGPDAGRGWRRMVMSPRPVEVLEHEQIELLAGNGAVVIAAGGGGIPVTRSEDGYRGLDAVIDKDRCSTELALQVGADLLVLTTSVARVSFDYGTRWQRDMERRNRRVREAGREGVPRVAGRSPTPSVSPRSTSSGTASRAPPARARRPTARPRRRPPACRRRPRARRAGSPGR